MKEKFDFDNVIYKFGQVEKELYMVLAQKTKQYFLDSWRRQAWAGVSWKPPVRQSRKGGSKRNTAQTLVQTGALRRAVNNSLTTADGGIIRFIVKDVPYAAIHNYGGVINKKSRQATANFSRHGEKGLRFTGNKHKGVVATSRHTIGAHSINMPKRQFMGDNPELRNIQRKTIKDYIRKIW